MKVKHIDIVEIEHSFQIMTIVDLLNKKVPLDEILENCNFKFVYRIVSTISSINADGMNDMNIDIINSSQIIFNDILKRYPIDKFPEKYI